MIEAAILDQVMSIVEAEGAGADIVVNLRSRFEGIHFTHCLEDELCLEKPIREGGKANLYLVNGHNHCATITTHEPSATGLLIAELTQ